MNGDVRFPVSINAMTRLYDEAQRMGLNVSAAFRRKAYILGNASTPKFALSGEKLTRTLTAGVNPNVYTKLVRLAERVGVPVSCIGELVCAFDMDGAAVGLKGAA
ncbi:hypothetical protein [Caballeronia sp. ATUFL_M2_KS44]|uniref:hypothetical protein n=1 Tax=Caballeronia sp. ATUFL_M2_KS44 TaxID=2921767 RepID=UPI00202986C1|nr:hypothetical protein [Caballeronia sp. ATUFL_M2_KS44]